MRPFSLSLVRKGKAKLEGAALAAGGGGHVTQRTRASDSRCDCGEEGALLPAVGIVNYYRCKRKHCGQASQITRSGSPFIVYIYKGDESQNVKAGRRSDPNRHPSSHLGCGT